MTRLRVGASGTRVAHGPARWLLVAHGALVVVSVQAQHVTLESTVSVTSTATHRSGSPGGGSSDSAADEVVAQISPGVIANVRGGNLQGSLSYSANAMAYVNDSHNNRISHSLASSGRYSILGGRAGFDASASASEQLISAYGAQGSGDTGGRANRAQTFAYSLGSFSSGQLLGQTTYQARLGYSASRAGSTSVGSTESLNGSAGLNGRLGLVGWALSGSTQVSDSELQDRTRSSSVFGTLSYSPDVEVQLSARYGREYQDVRTGQIQSSATWGISASWIPGPRTSVSADYDRRYFGDSYSVAFSHRMANSIWTFSDSRSVQSTPTAGRFDVSAYDLFFAQLASLEPDPAKRDQLVRAFLAARGIDPNGRVVIGGFLTSLASVQRRQQFTVAYQGLRYTAVASLTNGNTRSAVEGATGNDDLANNNVVRQRGLSLTVSYRIAASSSLSFDASVQRTLGTVTQSGNEVRSLGGSWSTQLNTRTSATVGVRYTNFDADAASHNESSIFGTLGLRF